MTKKKQPVAIAKVLGAMNALQLIARGATKVEACKIIGISTAQYDLWLAKGDDALVGLQRAIIESERIRLGDITGAQSIILARMIQELTTENVDVDSMLKGLQYLDKLREKLETKHGVNSETDDAETYLLKGPSTRVESSKMLTINAKANADGSVDVSLPVPKRVINYEEEDSEDEDNSMSSE